jgi:hypothetical protein
MNERTSGLPLAVFQAITSWLGGMSASGEVRFTDEDVDSRVALAEGGSPGAVAEG